MAGRKAQGPITVVMEDLVEQVFVQYFVPRPAAPLPAAQSLYVMLKRSAESGDRDAVRECLRLFKKQLLQLFDRRKRAEQKDILQTLAQMLEHLVELANQAKQAEHSMETAVMILEELRGRLFKMVNSENVESHNEIKMIALECCYSHMRSEPKGALKTSMSADRNTGMRASWKKLSFKVTGPDVSSWCSLWSSLVLVSGDAWMPLVLMLMEEKHTKKACAKMDLQRRTSAGAQDIQPVADITSPKDATTPLQRKASHTASLSPCQDQTQGASRASSLKRGQSEDSNNATSNFIGMLEAVALVDTTSSGPMWRSEPVSGGGSEVDWAAFDCIAARTSSDQGPETKRSLEHSWVIFAV